MDARILDEIIDVDKLEFKVITENGKMYRTVTNINDKVLWDAILFKIVKRLKYIGVVVPTTIITSCVQEYAKLPLRINIQNDLIDLPKSMQELLHLYDIYYTPDFPSIFKDIAWAGLGLWGAVRISQLVQEYRHR